MTALPQQGQLKVPVEWTGNVAKATMTAGSYVLSGTIGFRPWRETATLSWILAPADALALLNTLKAGKFNQVFDYTDNLRGPVRLRPTDSYSFQERRGAQMVTFTMSFETV